MSNPKKGTIYGIKGPVITVKNFPEFKMLEMVYVGDEKLIGEVIAIHGENTVIQVYEETAGLTTGESVEGTGEPMSVLLGPGLIGGIFDGIERPLKIIENSSGAFIKRGLRPDPIDMDKKWNVSITAAIGDAVSPLSVIAEVKETSLIINKVMIPYGIEGKITYIAESGSYTLKDVIARVKTTPARKRKSGLPQNGP